MPAPSVPTPTWTSTPPACAPWWEPDLYAQLEEAGFAGLNDVAARQSAFRQLFSQVTGLGQASAALFVDLVGDAAGRPGGRSQPLELYRPDRLALPAALPV